MIAPVPLSDYALLRRFAEHGDDEAFAELVGRHSAMARGVCRRVLGPAGDADDAAQSVFLSLATHAPLLTGRLGPSGSLAGWLYRVAVNTALQQRRAAKARRRREQKVLRERDEHVPGVTAGVERAELLVVLDEELKELPLAYRTPLVLCHLEGKTQHEAADELGLSYGTLRRRLDRGRTLLRNRLGRRGVAAVPVLLALLGKATSASAASPAGCDLGRAVLATLKGQSATVTVVPPRVESAARIPRPVPRPRAGSVPPHVYSTLLAVLVFAMMIPPVVSAIVTTTEPDATPTAVAPPTSPQPAFDSPGRSA